MKWPSELVITCRSNCFAGSVALTVASATIAPFSSVTVPVSVSADRSHAAADRLCPFGDEDTVGEIPNS